MIYVLALQTDSGRLYWGGMREMRDDPGYRWQENPHQACAFRDPVEAEHYRNENGLGHITLIVDFDEEKVTWRNTAARKDALHAALLAHPVRATFLIAEALPSDIVTRIETTVKES